jgi:hypothetical protein
MTNDEIIDAVTSYIEDNKETLREEVSDLIDQYKGSIDSEEHYFHDDIKAEFEILLRRELAEIVAGSLALDPEQVFLSVEALNVDDFLEEE